MTTKYNNVEIEVNEICDPKFGYGFRAEFYMTITGGRKIRAQRYDTYERDLSTADVVLRVRQIIDAFNY